METWIWIVIAAAVGVVVVVALLALASTRRRRRNHLRERFGPEYDRAVGQSDRRSKAEKDLLERERRREELDIRPLSAAARTRFLEEWQSVQQRFVDDPVSSTVDADRIVRRVMDERGYPSDGGDVEQRAADVSVDHPHVVERYRHGHAMVKSHESSNAEGTESLRKAMIDFRAVFEELLEEDHETLAAAR